MVKHYLSLSPDNVPDWGLWEAVREFLQNALDEGDWEVEYNYELEELRIINWYKQLPKSFFLTGVSGKRNDPDKRGTYGEGSGAALCVLVREGYDVTITSNTNDYTVYSEYCDEFEAERLVVQEQVSEEPIDGVQVVIKGITPTQYEDIYAKVLPLREIYKKVSTTKGDILLDNKLQGMVFCGGLYVNYFPDLDKGYDFKPSVLRLDRDRQMVRQFDVAWITKDMWKEYTENDLSEVGKTEWLDSVADSVLANRPDTQYMSYAGTSTPLQEAVYTKFKDKYGDNALIAEDAEEQQKLLKSGYKDVIFLGDDNPAKIIKQSEAYQKISFGVKPKLCSELLTEFKEQWYDEFAVDMLTAFEDMIDKVRGLE